MRQGARVECLVPTRGELAEAEEDERGGERIAGRGKRILAVTEAVMSHVRFIYIHVSCRYRACRDEQQSRDPMQ